jgi:hypothetical protein
MTWTSLSRARRIAMAASAFTLCVAAGLLTVIHGVGVPQAWWPHTGQAFATDTRPADRDKCAQVVGVARDYCVRAATAPAGRRDAAAAVWRLVAAGAGVAALMVWRRRSAGQRRS